MAAVAVFFFLGIKVPGGFGFSWHGVVVRWDAMLFDVSLPPITILHLSAPSARLVLVDIDWDRDRMQRIVFKNKITNIRE